MKVWTWAALAAGVMAAACASGGGRPDPERVQVLMSADAFFFVLVDADGDFAANMDEIEAGITREFARADANGDGSLTPIEYQTWANQVLGGGQMGPFRLDFDRNVDNIITQEEFRAELLARAEGYDTDENRIVTRSEMMRPLNVVRPSGPPRWTPDPQPGSRI
ncbi:MAG: hypothetical protein AB7P07_14050 [Hyphomonadaceae bacterium]